MIELVAIEKAHGPARVLAGIHAAFAPGEIVAVLGPSGAGKSTLLRVIVGLDALDGGAVRAFGTELRADAPAAERRRAALAVRRKVGLVRQDLCLFPHRTVLGNVLEGPVQVGGVAPEAAEPRARELLAELGLAGRAGAYPGELSGGEQQRVALARALAMEPAALLLDEPTSALDPARADDVRAILRRLAARGTALVVVTHETRFARAACDRRLVLTDGVLLDDPDDPRARPFLA